MGFRKPLQIALKIRKNSQHQGLSETQVAFGNPFMTVLAAYRKTSRNQYAFSMMQVKNQFLNI
jgi:hypothetical protein